MKKLWDKNNVFLLLSVLFGIISTCLNYQFGISDQIEQLPIIYRFLDDTYLVNDFFVNTNSSYSPRFYYVIIISFLAKVTSVPFIFFILTFLSNCFLSIVSFKTSKLIFKNNKQALFGAIMVLFATTLTLGSSNQIYNSYLVPSNIAFTLILWGFYYLLKKQLVLSIILCGIVSIFHILIGFEYGVLFFSIAILIDLRDKEYKKAILKTPYFLILILFLLFNIIPYFSQKEKIDDQLFINIVAFFRHPHHYILSYILTLKEIIKVLIFGSISIWLFLNWKKNKSNQIYIFILKTVLLILCFTTFLSWFFVEIIPNRLITTLQLIRLLDLLKWIGLLFLGSKIINLLTSLKIQPNISPKIKLIFSFSFCAILLLFSTIDFKKSTTKIIFKNYFEFTEIETSKKELIEFVKNNTPKDGVFLSPPDFGFLRVRAKRAIVIDFKAFPFQDKSIKEWYLRVKNCYGIERNNLNKKYRNLNNKSINKLNKKYSFNYAVLYNDTPTKFPVIYTNKKYKIITLEH